MKSQQVLQLIPELSIGNWSHKKYIEEGPNESVKKSKRNKKMFWRGGVF